MLTFGSVFVDYIFSIINPLSRIIILFSGVYMVISIGIIGIRTRISLWLVPLIGDFLTRLFHVIWGLSLFLFAIFAY
ncbi:hypothetical protein RI065_08530 [Mycoplasmatota bacterium zrk1]